MLAGAKAALPQVDGAARLTPHVADLLARELHAKRARLDSYREEREVKRKHLADLDEDIAAIEAEVAALQTPLVQEPIVFTSLHGR